MPFVPSVLIFHITLIWHYICYFGASSLYDSLNCTGTTSQTLCTGLRPYVDVFICRHHPFRLLCWLCSLHLRFLSICCSPECIYIEGYFIILIHQRFWWAFAFHRAMMPRQNSLVWLAILPLLEHFKEIEYSHKNIFLKNFIGFAPKKRSNSGTARLLKLS